MTDEFLSRLFVIALNSAPTDRRRSEPEGARVPFQQGIVYDGVSAQIHRHYAQDFLRPQHCDVG